MNVISKLEYAELLLPSNIQAILKKIPEQSRQEIREIRLRKGKKLSCTLSDIELFLTENGKLSSYYNQGISVSDKDLDEIVKTACQYSLHSYQKEIANGFITTKGGNRVGMCGTAVVTDSKYETITTIKDISSVNIRVAREVRGCADEIYNKIFAHSINSVLIVGVPSSGKTTILRDLCRLLGQTHKVCIIDERNEISATNAGEPQNEIGYLSDVFNGYPKSIGITTSIRVMSPQIIVCDEIGGESDVSALEYALNSGVNIIATTHASSINESIHRNGVAELIKLKTFNFAVLLGSGKDVGRVIDIRKLGDSND